MGSGNVRSGMSAKTGISQTQQGVGCCSTNQSFFSLTHAPKYYLVPQGTHGAWLPATLCCNALAFFFCHSCSHSAVKAFFPAQHVSVTIPSLVLLPVCHYSRPVRSILRYQPLTVHHLKISTYSVFISHFKFLLLVFKWSVTTAHSRPIDHSTGK